MEGMWKPWESASGTESEPPAGHGRVETSGPRPEGVYPAVQYVYKVARVERVLDGDTYWLHIDVGFRQAFLAEIRLLGYDTPEKVGVPVREREAAARATAYAQGFLTTGMLNGALRVETFADTDKYGRWLATVWSEHDGVVTSLGETMVEAGLASRWPTKWREAYPV